MTNNSISKKTAAQHSELASANENPLSSELTLRLERAAYSVFGKTRAHFLSVVFLLVRRELMVKYRSSVLGYLWSMLNPLLFMLTISFVFSNMFKAVENYNIYVLSGILVWNMTGMALVMGTQSLIGNAGLLKKVRIPAWVFPLSSVGSAATNFALALLPFAAVYIVSGRSLPSQAYLFPLVFVLYAIFLSGLIMALSTLNVFFRDVGHVLEPVLQILFYATPIIYMRKNQALPDRINFIIELNPFTQFLESFHSVMFGVEPLSFGRILIITSIAAVSLVTGSLIYKQCRREIIFHV